MTVRDRGRRRLRGWATWRPPLVLLALGTFVIALSACQLVLDPERVVSQTTELLVPLLFVAAGFTPLVYAPDDERAGEMQQRMVMVSLMVMSIAASVAGVVVLAQYLEGAPLTDALFVFVVAIAAGFMIGSPFGYFYHDALAKREALEAEVTRSQALNQRFQVVMRVLRHNVRNELTVARGRLTLLEERLDDETQAHALDQLRPARAAIDRLYSHAEKSLRIEELVSEHAAEPVDAVEVTESYLQDIDSEGIPVTFDLDLPASARVWGHPLIDLAIIELISNAIQHNDSEGLSVEIDVRSREEWVDIVVADDGTGIAADTLAVLSMEAETALEHGQGVGLWLIQWVVEASDGDLAFRDREGGGLAVTLSLPRVREAEWGG